MGDINLGASSNKVVDPKQIKQKMIYMNIPTGLVFVIESRGLASMKKYADAITQSIKTSLSNVEIRKTILQTFGVKTVKKMRRLKENEYDVFTEAFGKEIWGLQDGEAG